MIPDLITKLSASLAPMIAIVGALIAWQNVRTAKHKIKIDLFEKRLSFFSKLEGLVEGMYSSGQLWSGDPYVAFRGLIKEGQWLYPKELIVWIESNVGTAVRDMALKQEEIDTAESALKPSLKKELSVIRRQLAKADSELKDKFSPYLQLHRL